MGTIFLKVIEMSIAASLLMLLVIILRMPLKKAPKWFMGVLWAMVALRLIMPFQIEARIGFMPDISGVIEKYISGISDAEAIPEIVTHDYSVGAASVGTLEADDTSGSSMGDGSDIDYLPNEEIIVTTPKMNGLFQIDGLYDLFVRLQMVWLFGLLIVTFYAVFSFISIKKKTGASIELKTDEQMKNLACFTGIYVNGESEKIYICDEIDTPFILGIFRPVIYLPSGLDEETMANVLAHERAHIKRGDHLRKQFGFLLLAIHWFNPLVWISYMLFCKDIELACDERVISRMSLDEKKSYATSLLLCSTHQRLILAYPLAFGEVGVRTRVKQIFNYKKPTFWLIVLLILICGALSTCFLTSKAGDVGIIDDQEFSEIISVNYGEDTKAIITDGGEVEETPQDKLLSEWGTAFLDRDAETIMKLSTRDVQQKLINEDVLFVYDDGTAGFGWSSPWPDYFAKGKGPYALMYFSDEAKTKGEIHFMATDSEPHAYVYRETIEIGQDENGDYKVIKEKLVTNMDISSFEEMEEAYFKSSLDNDSINYVTNGLGVYLNNNAKRDTDGLYSQLFDPATAARYLLNLSDDKSVVSVNRIDDVGGKAVVSIEFPKENKYLDIAMIQPWGKDGIYVPEMKLPRSEYGKLIYDFVQRDAAEAGNYDTTEYVIVSEDEMDEEGAAGNLLYTENTSKEFVELPFSDISKYFDDASEHKSMKDGYSEEADLNDDHTWNRNCEFVLSR